MPPFVTLPWLGAHKHGCLGPLSYSSVTVLSSPTDNATSFLYPYHQLQTPTPVHGVPARRANAMAISSLLSELFLSPNCRCLVSSSLFPCIQLYLWSHSTMSLISPFFPISPYARHARSPAVDLTLSQFATLRPSLCIHVISVQVSISSGFNCQGHSHGGAQQCMSLPFA